MPGIPSNGAGQAESILFLNPKRVCPQQAKVVPTSHLSRVTSEIQATRWCLIQHEICALVERQLHHADKT